MKYKMFLMLLLFTALIIAACGKMTEKQLTPVTFMLDWVPNTNHTGIFVVQSKRYFDEVGLSVNIIQPGEVYPEAAVASGATDFRVSFQKYVTLSRADQIPIVSIAAIIQHNTFGSASAANLNVQNPADFEGLRYGLFGTPFEVPILEVLMNCDDGKFDQLETVNKGWADPLAIIAEGQIDIAAIFYGWQGIQAQQQGIDLNIIMMKDYSDCIPDYYTPVIVTSEENIANKPEVVRALLEALTRGYNFTIQNPEEAAELLCNVVPELNIDLVKASQIRLSQYYQADAPRWGEQKVSVWQNYTDWMIEYGILNNPILTSDAFTNEFLP